MHSDVPFASFAVFCRVRERFGDEYLQDLGASIEIALLCFQFGFRQGFETVSGHTIVPCCPQDLVLLTAHSVSLLIFKVREAPHPGAMVCSRNLTNACILRTISCR